jgi:predicted negative regulator of RcsB-dependent stress response
MWDGMHATDPASTSPLWSVSANRQLVGDALRAKGDTAGARRAYREALQAAETLARSDPASAEFQANLAEAQERLALYYR